jgi:hypothetical protein
LLELAAGYRKYNRGEYTPVLELDRGFQAFVAGRVSGYNHSYAGYDQYTSLDTYKPEPWIKQIKLKYVPPVPGRITGRSQFDQITIEVGSVIPPYAQTFGYNSQADAQSQAWVPPPVKQIDIFTAQQTWPL